MAIRFDQIELANSGHTSMPQLQASAAARLRVQSSNGYVDIGSGTSSSWGYLLTDRANFYFDKGVHFDGNIQGYGGDETAKFNSFIDSGNTAYYLNPAGTSILSTLTMYTNGATETTQINMPRAGFITFYGDNSQYHSISSRNSAGNTADDLRINSYGALYINLDSNNNNTSGAGFVIGRHGGQQGAISDNLFTIDGETKNVEIYGALTLPGTFTQTSGNFITHGNQTGDLNSFWEIAGTSKDRGIATGRFQSGASNSFTSANNANWIMNIYSHAGSGGNYPYGIQLGGTDTGDRNLMIRGVSNGTFGSWARVFHENSSDLRSPIFYDSNNTNYYVDPNNTGISLKMAGRAEAYQFRGGVTASGDGDDNQPFALADDYSSWAIIFGEAWTNNNGWGIFWAGNDNPAYSYWSTTNPNEAVFVGGGNVRASIDLDNGASYFANQVRTPILYDANDTGYYMDPAGTSHLNTIQVNDYIYHKGDTNTYIYFQSDSIKLRTGGDDRLHITNTETTATNSVKITSGVGGKLHLRSTDTAIVDGDYIGNLYFEGVDSGGAADNIGAKIHAIATDTWTTTSASTKLIFVTRNGNTLSTALTLNHDQSATFAGGITAGIVYDAADTNYYVDPSDQSRMKYLNLGTSPTSGITSGYIANIRGSMHMSNNNIDYVSQLHFHDNVRFYDDGNDNYLNFKWGDTNNGGIRFRDGDNNVHGYVYGDGDVNFGLLDKDGAWFILTNGSSYTSLRADNNEELVVYTNRVEIAADLRSPIYYDKDDTNYYVNPAGHSYLSGLLLENARVNGAQEYPPGHYTGGKEIWSFDPTWTDLQIQEYFGSSNVSWSAQSDAPGGWAIYVNGAVNVGASYNSGFPYIPVEAGAIYYMECYIKNAGTGQTHYMGSIERKEDLTSNPATGQGNPGTFGYWTMSNYNPGTSWTKVHGIIRGSDANAVGYFETETKYWTPHALFNYGAGSGTRACYISGWKVVKISDAEYFADGVVGSPSIAFAEDKDTGIFRPGSNQLSLVTGGSKVLSLSDGKVGINTTDPDSQGYPFAEDLVILGGNSASDGVGITLRGNGKTYGVIAFGDNADDNAGEIYYSHDNDTMNFRAATGVQLVLSANTVDGQNNQFHTTNAAGLRVDSSSHARIELDATDNWSYVRFMDSGNVSWDLATYDSGGLEIRPGGSGSNRTYFTSTGISISEGSKRAPLFYDSANTNYYVDPAGYSVLNGITMYTAGATDTGSVHLGRGAWITFYGNSDAHHGIGSRDTNGNLTDDLRINSYHNVHINLDSNNNNGTSDTVFTIGHHGQGAGTVANTAFSVTGGGIATATSDMRAPVFYDSGDTNYYVNPSGTIGLNTNGKILSSSKGHVLGTNSATAQTAVLELKQVSGAEQLRLTDGDSLGTSWGPFMSFYDGGGTRRGYVQGAGTSSTAMDMRVVSQYGSFSVYTDASGGVTERLLVGSDGNATFRGQLTGESYVRSIDSYQITLDGVSSAGPVIEFGATNDYDAYGSIGHQGGEYQFGTHSRDFAWYQGTVKIMELDHGGGNQEPVLAIGWNVAADNTKGTLQVFGHNNTDGTLRLGPHSSKGTIFSHVHYGSNGDWYIRPASNSGSVFVLNYSAISDERLKENIVDSEYGLSEITSLRPRNFNWIGSETDNVHTGFIAQEVEAVVPKWITEGELDDHKSVDYNAITATLVKAVQELKAENEDLLNRVKALENK